MFGLAGHLPELVIILVAALVIFGPKRLPEIGNAMGKTIKEFRHSVSEDEKSPQLKDEKNAGVEEPRHV
ncbi:MAG TPA: twin-arginine translocase TatA/TatE family subunit [Chloroflexota bacterium]